MKADKDYLPAHYELKAQPFFQGKGQLSVSQLEQLAEDFEEYRHQQQIIKQGIQQENSYLLQHNRELVEALKHLLPNMEAYGNEVHKDSGRWFRHIFKKEIELLTKHSKDV